MEEDELLLDVVVDVDEKLESVLIDSGAGSIEPSVAWKRRSGSPRIVK